MQVRAVLDAIGRDEWSRRVIMGRFNDTGGSLDRWSRADQWAMANAITQAEDAEETRSAGRWSSLQDRLRVIRHRLEQSLDGAEVRALRSRTKAVA